MTLSSIYLERYAYPKTYLDLTEFDEPGIIVVIPCHNEPDLIASLQSLENCEKPDCQVSIIIVINAGENAFEQIKEQNLKTLESAQIWANKASKYNYHFILDNRLPKKHAGVGLARKIGMDEAVRVFELNQRDGVILCYDADSFCQQNLLVEVEKLFNSDDSIPGCSIHFEHPLEGDLEADNYEGITNYELHLRYYIDGLKYSGFPYAFQTIGSSMAVRSSAYQKQGGMNRRKAGEDFYFLHRLIPLGNFRNLNSTKIIPSPRKSDRVPFGTGKAIGDWLESNLEEYQTYDYRVFEDLKQFFDLNRTLFHLSIEELKDHYGKFPFSLRSFLAYEEFKSKVAEFHQYSNSRETFDKRLYQWFDGFKVLKFVHSARDQFYPNIPISKALDWLFDQYLENKPSNLTEGLVRLRELNRKEASVN